MVPLLALVSLLAAETALLEGIEFAILDAILVIAFVILIGRYLLSPVLRLTCTHSREHSPLEVLVPAPCRSAQRPVELAPIRLQLMA